MEKVTRVVIYGFGRMGITHFAILNGIESSPDKKYKFTVLEKNKNLISILKRNFPNIQFFSNNDRLPKRPFDLCIITAPPFTHLELFNKSIERGDRKIFIEKPFGGHTNLNINHNHGKAYVGYVLRYNPCIQWVKDNIDPKNIKSVKAEYVSCTLQKKPQGWRNGADSGVLNEMGSHIIDLLNYILDLRDYSILSSNIKSIISDVDDEVSAQIRSGEKIIDLYFNWVKENIRKPVFALEFFMHDNSTVKVDQQKISILKDNLTIKEINVTNLKSSIPFYLRGVDFTLQMQDFIGENKVNCSLEEATLVNNIIRDIIKA